MMSSVVHQGRFPFPRCGRSVAALALLSTCLTGPARSDSGAAVEQRRQTPDQYRRHHLELASRFVRTLYMAKLDDAGTDRGYHVRQTETMWPPKTEKEHEENLLIHKMLGSRKSPEPAVVAKRREAVRELGLCWPEITRASLHNALVDVQFETTNGHRPTNATLLIAPENQSGRPGKIISELLPCDNDDGLAALGARLAQLWKLDGLSPHRRTDRIIEWLVDSIPLGEPRKTIAGQDLDLLYKIYGLAMQALGVAQERESPVVLKAKPRDAESDEVALTMRYVSAPRIDPLVDDKIEFAFTNGKTEKEIVSIPEALVRLTRAAVEGALSSANLRMVLFGGKPGYPVGAAKICRMLFDGVPGDSAPCDLRMAHGAQKALLEDADRDPPAALCEAMRLLNAARERYSVRRDDDVTTRNIDQTQHLRDIFFAASGGS